MFKPKIWLRLGLWPWQVQRRHCLSQSSQQRLKSTAKKQPGSRVLPDPFSRRAAAEAREEKGAKVVRAAKLAQAGLLLRPRLLHNSNRNPKPSNEEASEVRAERAASAASDPAASAPGPAGGNQEKEKKKKKKGSEVSTRATSSDSPRARIRRERGKKNLKTTR